MNDVSIPPAPELRVAADTVGVDRARLADAIDFALAHGSRWPTALIMPDGRFALPYDAGERPPDDAVLGPVTPRGGPAGVILKGGREIACWGDPDRPDMTFSIAKSYLALLAGLAIGDGLIRSLDDRAGDYALDDGFTAPQNRDITWRHLLQQTSEWEGTLFDKADMVDRHRKVGLTDPDTPKGSFRALRPPGTFWEYNDVRVNRLSLSLMQVFREPLPAVLKRRIMDPIGASSNWRWDGYRNSTVTVDGRPMLSVPGGGHWGGGIVIGARDHARIGLLVARDGTHDGRRILPDGWCAELRKPCAIAPFYGLMWWLNTNRGQFKAAPESSFFALGWGSHILWIDPEHDLVVVTRWIDKASAGGFIERVVASVAA
ncbi:MAG: serine hydrolase [Rhodospirillales bacterium]|nr:MAG: serine hydrolase [Rhodospirillales bacterium]